MVPYWLKTSCVNWRKLLARKSWVGSFRVHRPDADPFEVDVAPLQSEEVSDAFLDAREELARGQVVVAVEGRPTAAVADAVGRAVDVRPQSAKAPSVPDRLEALLGEVGLSLGQVVQVDFFSIGCVGRLVSGWSIRKRRRLPRRGPVADRVPGRFLQGAGAERGTYRLLGNRADPVGRRGLRRRASR